MSETFDRTGGKVADDTNDEPADTLETLVGTLSEAGRAGLKQEVEKELAALRGKIQPYFEEDNPPQGTKKQALCELMRQEACFEECLAVVRIMNL